MKPQMTFAIADIHGRGDLLEAVHKFIVDHASVYESDPQIVYLGDIGDRGLHSKKCFKMVARTLSQFDNSHVIVGNHDDWFLRTVRYADDRAKNKWLAKGGAETLRSYYAGEPEEAMKIVEEFHGDHLDLIENGKEMLVEGNVCFTHAGIKPFYPLVEQDAYDLMWVREEFMEHVGRLEKVIVHGHTVVGNRPEVTENRISLDTGAVATGRLTVCVIDWVKETVEFYQTDGDASKVVQVDPVEKNRGLGLATDFVFEKAVQEKMAA